MKRKLLERALFPRHAALNLAVMRVLVGGYATWLLWFHRLDLFATCVETPLEHWDPVGVLAWMSHPLPDAAFRALYFGCVGLGALFTLGVASRVVAPVFAALLLFALTYRQSWGFIYHTENLLVVDIAVLGLARSADTLSIDALLRRFVGARAHVLTRVLARAPTFPSWRYGFPVQLMILITGVTYWVAGMAKLGASGFSWATDAHLLDHLGNNALRYHLFAGGASPLTYVAFSWPIWTWAALGMLSLAIELSAPLAVLHAGLALFYALALLGFHWGVYLLMGIPFLFQLSGAAYAPFIRWDRGARAVAKFWRTRAAERMTKR